MAVQPVAFYICALRVGTGIDSTVGRGTKLQPIEIKSGQTITDDYIRAGLKAGRFAASEALQPWLIYGGDSSDSKQVLSSRAHLRCSIGPCHVWVGG